jgi:hypothetical protein
MSFFVVPTFVPPTLEQLTREPDEVAIIVSQEARIAHEVRLHCNQAFGVRWSGPQKFHDTSRGFCCSLPTCGTTIEKRRRWV